MAGRERRTERAVWLMRRDLDEVGRELRVARLAAGLTLRAVGQRANVSGSTVLRAERGLATAQRADVVAAVAAAVGMRARLRVYPDGEPLRDAAQVAMFNAFRRRLPAGLPLRAEQPVTQDPADRRAFDALLILPGCRCGIEFISRFHDCQAQLRQLHLKQRDGAVDRLILVVKATHHNRRVLRAAADVLAATLPVGTRQVWRSLSAGRDPGANGVVLL
jgi:transcriptional regulator with XRE-family HTH domain